MGSSITQEVNQRHPLIHHKSTFDPPKVQTLRRTYRVPSGPPFVSHDKECTESRSLSTRASLPSMQSNMYTQESSNFDLTRPPSSNLSKRSVSGMKQLLPLKLSSPQTPNFDSRSTSRSMKRTTFGQLGRLGGFSNLGDGAENKLASPPRISINPARYRDTPIFSQPGSLLLGGPLYQDKCPKCFNEAGCSTSCIIDEYESFSDSTSSKGYSSDYSDRHTPSVASSPISSRRRYQTDSEFSFKCLGEPSLDSESSWFDRPNKQRVNSRSSSVDIEEWLSDSSMCEGSDDDDSDDFFACATALAPAKAHVVQVNHKYPPRLSCPRLSITIPPQPKINANLKHSHSSALRKLTSRSPINDPAMSSPPTSPEEQTSNNFSNNQQGLLSPIDLPPTPASPDTILDIVAAIEDCTSNFPTKMLLADTPCISSIRSHLKATSRISAAQKSPQKLAPPTLPKTFNQYRPKYLSRRSRPQTICLSPTSDSQSFTSRIPATPPSTPPSSVDFSLSSVPSIKAQTKSSILPTFASQLAVANLQPLHAIFPISSDFLRSALYGHILSYIFILSLPTSNTANSDTHSTPLPSRSRPHTNYPTTSHPYPARKQHSYPQSFSSYHNTSIVGIPAKAASTLGLSSSTSFRRNLGVATQTKKIELNLRSCIGKILRGMEGRVDAQNGKTEVESWVLRSLVEVVRGCEGI